MILFCTGSNTETTLYCHHGIDTNNFVLDFHTDPKRLTRSNKYSSEKRLHDETRKERRKRIKTETTCLKGNRILSTDEYYWTNYLEERKRTSIIYKNKRKCRRRYITHHRRKKSANRTRNGRSPRNSEKSLERNNNTLPPHEKLTETVNFLGEGRNVADTLRSVHILQETPIC